jgi:hypothetical protein
VVIGGGAGAVGEYNLTGGSLSTARLFAAAQGARFNFAGGTLHADRVGFDLDNQGGVLWPGRLVRGERFSDRAEPAFGYLRVDGDLRLTRGSLHVALGAVASDAIAVAGDVWLGGELAVEPVAGARPEPGASWTILTARGQVHGAFAAVPSGYRVEVAGQRVLLIHGASSREPHGAAAVALGAR